MSDDHEWNKDFYISGRVEIEIEGYGSFGSDQYLTLIERAMCVLIVLTGNTFNGVPEKILELVSADPKTCKAVFRLIG